MFITMIVSGIWHGAAWTFVDLGRPARAGPLPDPRAGADRALPGAHSPAGQAAVGLRVCDLYLDLLPAQSLSDASLIISRIFTTGWTDPRFPLVMAILCWPCGCTS